MDGCCDEDCGSFPVGVHGVANEAKDAAAQSGLPILKGALVSLPLPTATANLGYGALGLGRFEDRTRLVLTREGEGQGDFNTESGDLAACLDDGPIAVFDSPRLRIGRTLQPAPGTYDTSWVKWVVDHAPWAAAPAKLLAGGAGGAIAGAVPKVVKKIRRAKGLDADESIRIATLPLGQPPEAGTMLRPARSVYDKSGLEGLAREAVVEARLSEAADRVRTEAEAYKKTPAFTSQSTHHQGRVELWFEALIDGDRRRASTDMVNGMGMPLTVHLWFYCNGPTQYIRHHTSWDS